MNRADRRDKNDATRPDAALKRSLVWFVIAIVFFVQVASIVGETQTVDEGAHLAAGVSYWLRGDFRMNPEHPPLLKLLAALPLLPLKPDLPAGPAWTEADEWTFGDAFLYENRFPPDTLLSLGRLPLLLLSLLLPLTIFLVVRKRYGWPLGFFALVLAAFEPTFLAHSRYVTTDVGAALTMFVATAAFASFLERPDPKRFGLAGLALGVSLLTKFSTLILLPTFLILLFVRGRAAGFPLGRSILGLFVLAGLTVWAGYDFQIVRPINDPRVGQLLAIAAQSRADGSTYDDPLLNRLIRLSDPTTASGQRLRTVLSAPVPAYGYVRGAIQVAVHNRGGHDSFLLGETHLKGRWDYFPVAFLVKEPLAFLVLVFLSLGVLAGRAFAERSRWKDRGRRVTPHALVFASVAFAYVAFTLASNLNLGIRHLLPLYPFLVLLVVAAVAPFWTSSRAVRFAVGGLVAAACLSTFTVHPSYLAYFNEAVGGPRNGGRYLTDSNLDWGQDLKRLRSYAGRNGVPAVCLAYFGRARPSSYGLTTLPFAYRSTLGSNNQPVCWTAVSASILFGDRSSSLEAYRGQEPVAKIGYSIYVFRPVAPQL